MYGHGCFLCANVVNVLSPLHFSNKVTTCTVYSPAYPKHILYTQFETKWYPFKVPLNEVSPPLQFPLHSEPPSRKNIMQNQNTNLCVFLGFALYICVKDV